jgi:hypothetical protein
VGINGDTSLSRIGRWNGSAWLSTGCFDGRVEDLTVGIDNTVYATGSFLNANGGTASRVAQWNGASWLEMSACGIRLSLGGGTILGNGIESGLDGRIYAGYSGDRAGGIAASGIAQWNGTGWETMSALEEDGTTSVAVNLVFRDSIGDIYAVGGFTKAGGIRLPDGGGQAIWNGTAWKTLDFARDPSDVIRAIEIADNGDLYVGGQGMTSASVTAVQTITNNGTQITKPILEVFAPSTASVSLFVFKNSVTQSEINFNLVLQAGEKVTLDFENITFVSDFRDNIIGNILPQSNLASFRMLPGENSIGLFTSGDGAASATLRWKKRHWSIDAGSSI